MSNPTPPRPGAADRNLLFGMLALQMEFLRADELVAAMQAWVFDKATPLGRILVGQGHLSPGRLELLNALVEEHLKAHDDDPRQSLASLSVPPTLEQELQRLGDGEVQASLIGLAPAAPGIAEATLPYSAPSPENTVAGLRYRVLRPHARGGLGEILVAEDLELHREVALKEIQQRFASDSQSRTRFLLEAEITGRLEHPGIVPVHGLGHYADGRPFYAMRLIRGDTLQEAIRKFHLGGRNSGPDQGETSLALRRLLTRFVTVCNAVAYAHNRGVIHRDLKPANIMLGQYGETLVLDWGLAKVVGRTEVAAGEAEQTLHPLSGDSLATQAGSTLGTAAFMSPEQAAGRIDRQGPASDIYSLGATLYTLLTGRAPFEGGAVAEMLRKVEAGEWTPPRLVNKDVPGALDAICRKAMALAPEDRYASALELGAEVERWLADEPVRAWAEPVATRLRRWAKRRPVFSAWVGISLVAYIAALAFGLILGLVSTSPTDTMVVLPAMLAIVTALIMSVASQGAAVLGAAAGFLTGFLSAKGAQRPRRGARWAVLGGRAGLLGGAALGYAAVSWFIAFRMGELPPMTAGLRVSLFSVIALGPILGGISGMILGSRKAMRLRGAVLGGIVGACLASGLGFLLFFSHLETSRQQLELSRQLDYRRLVGAQLTLKKHADAAQTAAELLDVVPDNADNAFAAAICLALCVRAAEEDSGLPAAEREKVSQKYADQAVAALREAVRRGDRNIARMRNEPDLDPIRQRPEFQELLRELR